MSAPVPKAPPRAIRTLRDPWQFAAAITVYGTLLTMVLLVMAPWFRDLSTYGFHDWDSQTAHRYLVRKTLLEHSEFPFWNPYSCGGFPAWGYVEAGTTVVSPWLIPYLVLPMSWALRVEVFGMALLGAFGAYVLAGRFSKSHAARALVVVLWAVNGRWALQAASGHTWHLAYAYLPWCLYFFERARERPHRALHMAVTGMCFAMLIYAGGIYPLPHAVLALGLYAVLLSVAFRSARPVLVLAACGALGVGLAAPKLLPILDAFGKAPRLIDSKEVLDAGAFLTLLTSRDQAFYSRPARVSPYGWHEWGMYISTAGLLLLAGGFIFSEGRREAALKFVGAAFVALGFGAFHPAAPWTLLHRYVPVFRSQHVPSRFLYPAVLFLALVAAAGLGRWIARRSLRAPWVELVAAVAVLLMGLDIAAVAQKPMAGAMWMVPPEIPRGRTFHFEHNPPFNYKRRDWAGPIYLAMLGNTGVLDCYGTPPFHRKGARAIHDPAYRGEAYIAGEGSAKIAAWSPNRVTIDVKDAGPGAIAVYNMNYDEGWRSDAGPVIAWENTVAVRVPQGASRVVFRYYPPGFTPGLVIGLGTAAAIAWRVWRERRIARGLAA